MIIVMMVLIITDSIASVLEEIGVTLVEFKPHAHLWDFLDRYPAQTSNPANVPIIQPL